MNKSSALWLVVSVWLTWGMSVAADFQHRGNQWSCVIGDDGLLKSFQVGATEVLQSFPDKNSACVLYNMEKDTEEVRFESVRKTDSGSIEARGADFALEYVFTDDHLTVRYRNLVMGKHFVMLWRPAATVIRAVDSEDDTSVDPKQNWYDDMVDGRWLAESGEVLTIQMRGYWTRRPYTDKGVSCYGTTVYQRAEGEWIFRPEVNPSAPTALVFEIQGENPDFLPPGGKPAVFPCAAENLGKTNLTVTCRTKALEYTDRAPVLEKEQTFTIAPAAKETVPVVLELKQPGVYRGELELRADGQSLKKKVWSFCYDFANWQPRCPKPKDFEAFWKSALAELAEVLVDLKREKVSEDDKCALYKLSYAVLDGERAYAWLRVPKGQKLPARLELPPSGVNKLPPPAESPAVEMKLAIHGYDVDFSNLKWEPPYPWPGGRYHNVGLEKKETYFYRNVYLRCVRAVDVLASLPEVDATRIMVFGGSQGGGLAVIAAALNSKVAFCAPGFPGLCRLDWTVKSGVGSWPLSKADVPEGQTLDQMLATLSYFDVANFIGSVNCPIVGTIGWMDDVTAAGGQMAAFAQADKTRLTLLCAPWGRHGADSRTQNAFYATHTEFLQGKPISLPKTWEVMETK